MPGYPDSLGHAPEATIQDADIEMAAWKAAADEASIAADQDAQVRRTTMATEAIEARAPRELAQHLYDSLALDTWPRPAAVIDWGIDTPSHLGALQHAIKSGATAADLDDACGSGERINALIAKFNFGRYPDITFATVYDTWDSNEEE